MICARCGDRIVSFHGFEVCPRCYEKDCGYNDEFRVVADDRAAALTAIKVLRSFDRSELLAWCYPPRRKSWWRRLTEWLRRSPKSSLTF